MTLSSIILPVALLLAAAVCLALCLKLAAAGRKTSELDAERMKDKAKLENEIAELKKKEKEYLAQIEKLKAAVNPDSFDGLFPICSNCKDIRDSNGYWHSIEEYAQGLSEAEFSHSLCPNCARKLYPDIFDGTEKKAIVLKWSHGSNKPLGRK